MMHTSLPDSLLEKVLTRLGCSDRPALTLQALGSIYSAWCQLVPFDNVRKLIHLQQKSPGPLPGDDAVDFFHAWLKHGTGGTCWAGNGALQSLLISLGFDARLGIATMLVAPDLPPNHGSVCVKLDGRTYLMDASILHGDPLRLDPEAETSVAHDAWGVSCTPQPGSSTWLVRWRPLHHPDGLDCRIDRLDATKQDFQIAHENTRGWSPFNYELNLRINRDDAVIGCAQGRRQMFHANATIESEPLDQVSRAHFLIETIGLSEEIVSALPPDVKTPPPPGSRTARHGVHKQERAR